MSFLNIILPPHLILVSLCAASCQVSNPAPAASRQQPESTASPATLPRISAVATPSISIAPEADSPLVSRINRDTTALLSSLEGKPAAGAHDIFTTYTPPRPKAVVWSRNWTWQIDLTGVAWEKPQTLTLISPRHGLMAKHYRRKDGSTVVFHNRAGKKISRKLVTSEWVKGTDIAVALLDKDVPEDLKYYRVLPPSPDYETSLPGALTLITNKLRQVHIHKIQSFNPRVGTVGFRKADELPAHCFENLIKGDSGNPAFLWLRGEPVLIETHSSGGGGAGPFFGSPRNFEGINAAMRRLSETHSAPVYQLKTVKP